VLNVNSSQETGTEKDTPQLRPKKIQKRTSHPFINGSVVDASIVVRIFEQLAASLLLSSSYCCATSNLDASTSSSSNMQSRLAQYTAARSSLHESIIDTIGKTPIIKLQRMAPKDVNVYVKLECKNPGGSLKDCLAYGVVEWAEKHGHLKPGQVSELKQVV
jgi:hypothetical protein